jgi:SAM-dependent methyltransferase
VRARASTDLASIGQVHDFWDGEACGERYGDDQDRRRYELEPEILAFADFAAARGQRVIEIGVGMGADFLRWLRAGADATGVDLTERAVGLARARAGAEGFVPDLRVADAERLPFADASFDLVWSWGVLHHTPDTALALREACRVLRPGGRLKVMLYHRRSWVALAAWVRHGLLVGRPGIGIGGAVAQVESPGTQAFTTSEARAMLAGAGLEAAEVRPRLTHRDRKWFPGVAPLAGDRFGWFLLVEARRPE